IASLSRIAQDPDLKKVAGAADDMFRLSDDLLAQALLSLVYALDIGPPDGTTLTGGDPSRRHDFGFQWKDREHRTRVAWGEPREVTAPGTPRHVTGSLLGLDVA